MNYTAMKQNIFQNENNDFWNTLQKRVNVYFKQNNLSKYSNTKMNIKIGVMLCLFIVPYILLLSYDLSNGYGFTLCVTMGIGMAGIGFNISHQAAHNAISRNRAINRLFSLSFNLVGMSDYIWKIKHNVYHHTYTNIYAHDEALKEGESLRLSNEAPLKAYHRYQHIYGFFIYAFFTLFWAFVLDFEKFFRYKKLPVVKNQKHPLGESLLFFSTKIYYVFLAFIIPAFFGNYSASAITIGFLTVHIVASLLITHVLQVEHLALETSQPQLTKKGTIEKSWAQNQLEGTCNFKSRSRIFNWYIGGCNYQIEHHLFPTICTIHYPKISKIVQQTAKEFNFSYTLQPNFGYALKSHYQFLKQMGKMHA